jgi:hypothetical protein
MTLQFTYLGTTDEVDTCDCCGKTNLKCTVAFEKVDGAVVHFGTTCAARHTGLKLNEWESKAREAKQAVEREVRARIIATPEHKEVERVSAEARALKLSPGTPFRTFTAQAFDALASVEKSIRAEISIAVKNN